MTSEERRLRERTLQAYIKKVISMTNNAVVTEQTTVADALGLDANNYINILYKDLDLSQRAFNCITRYLNPPIQGIEERWQVSDLLNLTIGNYVDVRNLGIEAFSEILSTLNELR